MGSEFVVPLGERSAGMGVAGEVDDAEVRVAGEECGRREGENGKSEGENPKGRKAIIFFVSVVEESRPNLEKCAVSD